MNRKGLRTTVIIAVFAVVLILVLLRVFDVWPKPESTEGTIGGVEKVDRFRGEQLSMGDIDCDDPETARFIQSAEFQNLMKNASFQSVLNHPDQVQYVPLAIEVSQLLDEAAQNLHNFLTKGNNAVTFFSHPAYASFYEKYGAMDQNLPKAIKANAENFAIPQAQEIQNAIKNLDFQKYVKNLDFNSVYNQDIQGVMGADFVKYANGNFESLMPELGAVYANSDFQSMVKSQAFQSLITSQPLQNLLQNQDALKVLKSQTVQAALPSQSFQAVIKSAEFKNLLGQYI